jgi:hypothetical protein
MLAIVHCICSTCMYECILYIGEVIELSDGDDAAEDTATTLNGMCLLVVLCHKFSVKYNWFQVYF